MTTKLPLETILALFMVAIMIAAFVFLILFLQTPEVKAFNTLASAFNDMCARSIGDTEEFSAYVPDSSGQVKASITGLGEMKFFYFVIDGNTLRLKSRRWSEVEPNDIGAAVFDAALSKPGHIEIKSAKLKSCAGFEICGVGETEETPADYSKIRGAYINCAGDIAKGIIVVGRIGAVAGTYSCYNNLAKTLDENKGVKRCNKFAFEPSEGAENMNFLLVRLPPESQKNKGMLVIAINKETVCGDGRCCSPENNIEGNANYCPSDCANNFPCKINTA